MANIKIAQLTQAYAFSDTDLMIIEDALSTKKITMNTLKINLGVDSGKIIESGSNTNGRYIKFEDGTLICWGTIPSEAISIAMGSGFRTESVTRNLPYSLHTVDLANIQTTGANFAWATGTILSTTQFLTALMSFDSGRNASGYWKIIGRWKA